MKNNGYDSMILEINLLRTEVGNLALQAKEPSYLELRGALDMLVSARRRLRLSGREGSGYYFEPKSTREAYDILSVAETFVGVEMAKAAAKDMVENLPESNVSNTSPEYPF
jgi:hypothetical protein